MVLRSAGVKKIVYLLLLLCFTTFAQELKNTGVEIGKLGINVPVTGLLYIDTIYGVGHSMVYGTPDSSTAFPKRVAKYLGKPYKLLAVASTTSAQCLSQITSNYISPNGLVLCMTGINDSGAVGWETTTKANYKSIDSLLRLKCKYHIFYHNPPDSVYSNSLMASFDTIDTYLDSISSYAFNQLPKVAKERPGDYPGNLHNPKTEYKYDAIHQNRDGYLAYADTSLQFLIPIIQFTDTNNIYHGHTPRNSLPIDVFPLTIYDTLRGGTVDNLQTTVTLIYHINSGADNSILLDRTKNTNNFSLSWNPTVVFADTIHYYLQAKSFNRTVNTAVTTRVVTVPTDSLICAFDFESNKGLGKNTYAQVVPSLYGSTTLTMGADDNTGKDDPTDSTSNGFIYMNSDSSEYCTLSTLFFHNLYTVIVKIRGYANTGNLQMFWGDTSGTFYCWGKGGMYTIYNALWTGGTGLIYATDWGRQGDDSTTAVTSELKLYRSGVVRLNGTAVLTGDKNVVLWIGRYKNGFYLKGRFYYIYIYNRILTQTQIAKFQ